MAESYTPEEQEHSPFSLDQCYMQKAQQGSLFLNIVPTWGSWRCD